VIRRLLALIAAALAAVAMCAAAAVAATPSPTPSATPTEGLGINKGGAGFVVLAAIIVGALLFSTWRLRRGR
jgi:hypothetical protein